MQKELLGAPAFSDVDTENDNACHIPIRIAPRLIHKIQVAQIEGLGFAARQLDWHGAPDKGLACLIYPVKDLNKTLFLCFRYRFPNGLADHVASTNQFLIRRFTNSNRCSGPPSAAKKAGAC